MEVPTDEGKGKREGKGKDARRPLPLPSPPRTLLAKEKCHKS